jgi:uncharacterized protein (TIGR03083 family)
MTPDVARAIAEERGALIDVIAGLDDGQLRSPSLCEGWTVHHVAAHLTMPFNVSAPEMLWRALVEPMSISGAIDRFAQENARRPIDGILAQLRDHITDTTHPPGQAVAPLIDLIVHGEDICRPLGLAHPVRFERAGAAIAHLTRGRAIGFLPGSRLRGLRFVATDGDGAWGQGQIVHGPVVDLLLGALGRRVAFDQLGGAVHTLRERVESPGRRAQR